MTWYKGWIIMIALNAGMVAEAMEDESDKELSGWLVVSRAAYHPSDYHPNSPTDLVVSVLEATYIGKDEKPNTFLPMPENMAVDREGGPLSEQEETPGSDTDCPAAAVGRYAAGATRLAAEEDDDHPPKRAEISTDTASTYSYTGRTRRGTGGRNKKGPQTNGHRYRTGNGSPHKA